MKKKSRQALEGRGGDVKRCGGNTWASFGGMASLMGLGLSVGFGLDFVVWTPE